MEVGKTNKNKGTRHKQKTPGWQHGQVGERVQMGAWFTRLSGWSGAWRAPGAVQRRAAASSRGRFVSATSTGAWLTQLPARPGASRVLGRLGAGVL